MDGELLIKKPKGRPKVKQDGNFLIKVHMFSECHKNLMNFSIFFRILCTNEKTFKKAVDFLRIYKLYDNIRDKFFLIILL